MQERDERTQAGVDAVKSWGELPLVLFFGAGASAAPPLNLPTTASFWERAQEEVSRTCPELLGHLHGIIARSAGSPDVEGLWPVLELCEKQPAALESVLTLACGLRPDLTVKPDDWSLPQVAGSGGRLIEELVEGRAWLRQALFDLYGGFTDPVKARAATDVFGRFLQGLYKATEAPVLPIFTTNYDLALEAVDFAAIGWPAAVRRDGRPWDSPVEVATWEPRHYDFGQPAAVSVAVVKLHGSLNWELRQADDCIVIQDRSVAEPAQGRADVLIYPGQHGDVDDEWPFAHARSMLRQALHQARTCVVVGFSMRDAAIAGVFRDAIAAHDLQVLLLDPADGWPTGWLDNLGGLIEEGTALVHEPVPFGTEEAFDAVLRWLHLPLVQPPKLTYPGGHRHPAGA